MLGNLQQCIRVSFSYYCNAALIHLDNLLCYSENVWFFLEESCYINYYIVRWHCRRFAIRTRYWTIECAFQAYYRLGILYFYIYQACDDAQHYSQSFLYTLYYRGRYNFAYFIYYCRLLVWTANCIPLVTRSLSVYPLVVISGLLSLAVCDQIKDQGRVFKPPGSTALFRMVLSNLLRTRLNPRAQPFKPTIRVRKRWEYVVDPATNHLRLPVKYNGSLKGTRLIKRRKSDAASVKPKQLDDAAQPNSCIIRSARANKNAVLKQLHKHITLTTSTNRKDRPSRSRPLRPPQGRHRRHRRHRKHALRGLPTPASSLYALPRESPSPLLHEGIAHDLEDHG